MDNLAGVRGLVGVPLDEGLSDYLVKPFEAGELEGVLERLLPKKNSVLH